MEVGVEDWRNYIESRVNGPECWESWEKLELYRLPVFVKELNPKAYKPQVVSLGPYYYGDPDLRAMEEYKERALIHFLRQAKKPLSDFWRGMEEIVHQLQNSYGNTYWRYGVVDHEFLRVMIVDGCFMLEVLRVAGCGDYSSDDATFNNRVLCDRAYIRRDMLLIENQLPLLVLDKLVEVRRGIKPAGGEINKLVLQFVSPDKTIPEPNVGRLGLHPLDLYHKSLIEPRIREPRWGLIVAGWSIRQNWIIRSALELAEAGIRFNKTESLQDIKFDGNVLSLPAIVVDEFTEHVFLNLMQVERFHGRFYDEVAVTNYVVFMNNLINSAKDVSLLRSQDIINNYLESDEDVANIFNALSKEAGAIADSDGNLHGVYWKLDVYCQKKRNRWRKKWNRWLDNLIHTYFSSPWSLLSLAAAIILLALTVAQTVYTILSYYYR